MFGNTTKLKGNGATSETTLVDGPTNRRTIRTSADGNIQLTIAHNESNENPGFVNQRSNVRVEKRIPLDDTDKTLKAYAQLTFSFPKDHAVVADLTQLIEMLMNFVAHGENADSYDLFTGTDTVAVVTRLFAGEP